MTKITIELTEVQTKAMYYITTDPQDWVYKTVETRVDAAIQEIVKLEMEKALAENRVIQYANTDEIVLNTSLPNAAERNKMFEQELEQMYAQRQDQTEIKE